MRVIDLVSPRVDDDGPPIYSALSTDGERWVACAHGRDLEVHDLTNDAVIAPTVRVPGGANHALGARGLVCFTTAREFVCLAPEGNQWREVNRFPLPAGLTGWPAPLALSPSARYLACELPGESSRHGVVVLLDLARGEPRAVLERHLDARAHFARLDGAEVLFVSAPSYMAVRVIDCATGAVRHAFDPSSSWDFCHVDYELSADATRLLTFGCVWAAPYEVRLYDATPWSRGRAPASTGFPLPLLASQGEDIGCEMVLPSRFTRTSDGCISVLSLVRPRELPDEASDEARDFEADLTDASRAIVAAVRRLDADRALLLRRIAPQTGAVAGWTLAPVRPTDETHVHLLDEHNALLVNEGVQRFDGATGVVTNVASLAPVSGSFWTVATRDGETVVRRVLGAPRG